MIRNDKQYYSSRRYLKEFEETLQDYRKNYKEGDYLQLLEMKGVESRIRKFREEITEYEALRQGTQTTVVLQSFAQLPELLIKARIARNWTQAELAEKVGLKEQQIQKYESTDYAGASTWKLLFILDALQVSVGAISVQVGKATFDTGVDEHALTQAQQELESDGSLLAKPNKAA